MALPELKEAITEVIVQGLKEINRAVIFHQDKGDGFYEMIIDGNDLGGVLATPGRVRNYFCRFWLKIEILIEKDIKKS